MICMNGFEVKTSTGNDESLNNAEKREAHDKLLEPLDDTAAADALNSIPILKRKMNISNQTEAVLTKRTPVMARNLNSIARLKKVLDMLHCET